MEAFRKECVPSYAELEDLKDNLSQQAAHIEDGNEAETEEEEIQRRLEERAGKQANRLIRKNKRELDRLKKHAGNCLITNNKAGYCYALKKLRDFYRQPYNEELIEAMWNSSRKAALDIAAKHAEHLLKQ